VAKGNVAGGTGLTLEQLHGRVSEEASRRARPRQLLIELGELAQQTRLRHLTLYPTPDAPLQVAALYLVHVFKALSPEKRTMFYRAVYPFFISAGEQEDVEHLILEGRSKKFYLSLQAFQFLAFFGSALLPAQTEGPGYWNREIIRAITRSSITLLTAHYLMAPTAFAARLHKLSSEAGNAFTMRRVRDTKAFIEYLYEHTPEALATIAELFPRDVAQFVVRENALFTARFVAGLYPDLRVTFVEIPRKTGDNGGQILSTRALLRFPRSSPLRSFAVFGSNLASYLRGMTQRTRHDQALAEEGVLVDSDASGLFEAIVPLWRKRRRELFAAFPPLGRHEPFFELPLYCKTEPQKRRTTSVFETIEEEAHHRALRGASSLRQELLDTGLQISDSVAGRLSFTTLDGLVRTAHAFYRRYDPGDTFHGHSHRVGMILTWLVSFFPDFILPSTRRVYVLGLLHDLGKLLIPPEVLNKKGRLNEIEWMFIRLHPLLGALLFAPCIGARQGVTCAQIAFMNLLHHENWSGGGYPYGLAVREDPHYPIEERLAAEASSSKFLVRLLRIADSLDAMISKAFQPRRGERAYHVTIAAGADEAGLTQFVVKDLRARAGDWYDPELVDRLSSQVIGGLIRAYARLASTAGLLVPPAFAELPGGAALLETLKELDPFRAS